MSDNVNPSPEVEKTKAEKIYDSVNKLEIYEVVESKRSTIKELVKLIKQMGELDVTKGSDRNKLAKLMEKSSDQLFAVSVIDKVLKEKDF
jgi:hypothetical protein